MKFLTLLFAISLFCACSSKQKVEPAENPESETKTDDVPKEEIVEEKKVDETIGADPVAAPEDVGGIPDDATVLPSGLAFRVLREGIGMGKPTTNATVTAHYTGWQTDGKMFDSSVARGEPFTAPLGKLIVGWQEGMVLMTKGERRRFWIPGAMAYDNSDRPDAPKGMLVFDIELIDFSEPDVK